MNYDTHDRELLATFKALKHWHQYLEGSTIPVDIIIYHKNLKYFTTTKLLTCHQARWSEYLSQFNMVIHFDPGKLCAKLNALTRHWDVYHKGGNSDFTTANPSNFCPIFMDEELNASLWATHFTTPILHTAVIMDIKQLHNTIRESYPLNPVTTTHSCTFPIPSGPLMIVVHCVKTTTFTFQMPMTFDSRSCSTSTITFCQDTSDRIKFGNSTTRLCMAKFTNLRATLL